MPHPDAPHAAPRDPPHDPPHDAPYDALETRAPADRERALMQALALQVAHAQRASVAQAARLHGIDPARVDSRAALARLPVLRKHELVEAQKAARAAGGDPFAGYAAITTATARQVFQSPGPLYEPAGRHDDGARMARALHAAGLRPGDLVHNSYSYHLTPAGAMMEAGAHALGCAVFPGGVGNTELQLQAIADLRPRGYVGTPSFLKILVEKASELGTDIGSLRVALVSGEACPAPLRQWFADRGLAVSQCYATADLGLIAYETASRDGLVVDEGVIVEIVRPGTGEPVPDAVAGQPPEVGEVVVTTLNPDYPLIRFGTGDLSAVLPGPCPTGRTNLRLRGWLGRADQVTKVRGMFVHPGQVTQALRGFPGVRRARLVVGGELGVDTVTLHVEPDAALVAGHAGGSSGWSDDIARALREATRLRCEVTLEPPGSLPEDGRLIEDRRTPG